MVSARGDDEPFSAISARSIRFGETLTSAGETPAIPKTNYIVPV
jgi:hypothetical protein